MNGMNSLVYDILGDMQAGTCVLYYTTREYRGYCVTVLMYFITSTGCKALVLEYPASTSNLVVGAVHVYENG